MKKMTNSSVSFISTDLLKKSFSRIRLNPSRSSIRPVKSMLKSKLFNVQQISPVPQTPQKKVTLEISLEKEDTPISKITTS